MNAKEAREFNYEASGVLFEQDVQTHDGDLLKRQEGFAQPWKTEIMWNKVISISLLHIGAVYGVLLISSASWKTDVFGMKKTQNLSKKNFKKENFVLLQPCFTTFFTYWESVRALIGFGLIVPTKPHFRFESSS